MPLIETLASPKHVGDTGQDNTYVKGLGGMKGTWCERGFDDFRDGTFGNGGQNLYVSRAGVLQRLLKH